MDFLYLLLLIAALVTLYTLWTNRRERELEKRLENIHNPVQASLEVDKAISQARADAEFLKRVRRY